MAQIFLSYSRRDTASADRLFELATSKGFDVWMDRKGIEGGTEWATEIAGSIRGCSIFLLLLSEHSVTSTNVLKELS